MNKLFVSKVGDKGVILAGEVVKVEAGGIIKADGAECEERLYKVEIKGTHYDNEQELEYEKTVTVNFWNPKDQNAKAGAKLASRVKNAKLAEGSFVVIYASETEKKDMFLGNDFKFTGIYNFKEKDDRKGMAVISGYVIGVEKVALADGREVVRVTIPVDYNNETRFHQITFFKTEYSRGFDKMVDMLSPRANGSKVRVVIKATETNEYTNPNSGNVSYQNLGNEFDMLDSKFFSKATA